MPRRITLREECESKIRCQCMYFNLYMLTPSICPAVLLGPIDPASFGNLHLEVCLFPLRHEPLLTIHVDVVPTDQPGLWAYESRLAFPGSRHSPQVLHFSEVLLVSAVAASMVQSMYETGKSIPRASVDSRRIFVNAGFQTELELSSQDQAAEPPETAYASIMPCTAP